MFNVGVTGSSGHNGISQLAGTRSDFPDKLLNKVKLRNFICNDDRDNYRNLTYNKNNTIFPSRSDETSKEDVYTFSDSDPFVNVKGSNLSFSNLNNVVGKARLAPTKKAQARPSNGFDVHRETNSIESNGVKKVIQKHAKNSNRVAIKTNKDLFRPDDKSESQNGLINITKNSIINSNSKSVVLKHDALYQPKKVVNNIIKQESLNEISTVKPTYRKLPSGKPHPTTLKQKNGRGPIVHEALQRITPKTKWHAPTSDLFDCGAIDLHSHNADSDSSDDSIYDNVDNWWSDSHLKSERSRKIASFTTSTRRRITELKQMESMINFPKSATSLYRAVKNELKKCSPHSDFRLEGPALDILLSSRLSDNILNSTDRRRIRCGRRRAELIICAHPGCKTPSLACARFCLAHISLNPEKKLFSECVAKSNDNKQCRAPVANVANDRSLCPKHVWKTVLPLENTLNSKLKQSPKKCQSASVIKTTKSSNLGEFSCNPQIFPPAKVSPAFLQRNNITELNVCSNSSYTSSEDTGIGGLSENELIGDPNHSQQIVDVDVVADVLHAMHELPLELAQPDPPQEANIDLTTVLNDFFTEHNEEYVPTREETEELERALEAVNQDVKSLEKLTSSHHSPQHSLLLDSFLDEKALAETLASLPDVFNNIPPVKVSCDHIVDPSSSTS